MHTSAWNTAEKNKIKSQFFSLTSMLRSLLESTLNLSDSCVFNRKIFLILPRFNRLFMKNLSRLKCAITDCINKIKIPKRKNEIFRATIRINTAKKSSLPFSRIIYKRVLTYKNYSKKKVLSSIGLEGNNKRELIKCK